MDNVLWKGNDGRGLASAIRGWVDEEDGEGEEREGVAVFCVGNTLRGDDAFGPLTARLLDKSPFPVFDCSVSPEAYASKITMMNISHVILVDGVFAEESPGTLVLFKPGRETSSLESCHRGSALLRRFFEQCGVHVIYLGCQVDSLEFGAPASPAILDGAVCASIGLWRSLSR